MALAFTAIIGGGFSRMGYGRRIAIISAVAVGFRILGFVVQAASEEAAWLNVLQYAVPVAATYVGLRGIFREKVSRFIDMRLKPHRISRRGEAPA